MLDLVFAHLVHLQRVADVVADLCVRRLAEHPPLDLLDSLVEGVLAHTVGEQVADVRDEVVRLVADQERLLVQ